MLEYKDTKIRPLTMGDLDNIMTWVNDAQVVGRYAYFAKSFTKEQEASWLEEKLNSSTDFFYGIENEKGEVKGMGIEQLTSFSTRLLTSTVFIKYTYSSQKIIPSGDTFTINAVL